MKEGAWINTKTGEYRWIDEHAKWIQVPGNATALGLPDDVIEALGKIPWDFNGDGRRAILMLAMGQGLVRARGHGSYTTFEHTIPTEEAVLGARLFMAEHLGPHMTCRFNDLRAGTSVEFRYGRVAENLGRGELGFLVPPWKRPITPPPVPRPFLLQETLGVPGGWTCWTLPDHLDPHALVALLREHVPEGSGWLALPDGRTWKLSPGAPPLSPLDPRPPLNPDQLCPDCGWPTNGPSTPCQCGNRIHCRCGVPRFWPVPGKDIPVSQRGTIPLRRPGMDPRPPILVTAKVRDWLDRNPDPMTLGASLVNVAAILGHAEGCATVLIRALADPDVPAYDLFWMDFSPDGRRHLILFARE